MKSILAVTAVFLTMFALQPVLSSAEEQYVHGTVVSVAENVLTVSAMDENNAEQSKVFTLTAETEVDGVESAAALAAGDMVEVFYESAEGKDTVTFVSKVEADIEAGDAMMEAGDAMMDAGDAMMEAGEAVQAEAVEAESVTAEAVDSEVPAAEVVK